MIPRMIFLRRAARSRSTILPQQAHAGPPACARPFSRASAPSQASTAPNTKPPQGVSPTITVPLPSLASTIARLLPSSVAEQELNLGRKTSEDIVSKVLDQVRAASNAASPYDARAGWEKVDTQIRSELSSQGISASHLTALGTVLVSSSNDPRRHPIAFNLFRIAFGSDPASLPRVQLSTKDLTSHSDGPPQRQSGSLTPDASSAWGDWQSAYHWATLVLSGRAPPPPGTHLLLPGEQRAAQSQQSAAAFQVFSHLARQGHPRGIFGIGRHLLSTLERGVDPTAMRTMPTAASGQQPSTREETMSEVIRLYRLAGEGGVEEAWFELGALFAEGKWVRKDDARARSFLEEGVERGSPRACQALAQLLAKEVESTAAPSSLKMDSEANDGANAASQRTAKLQRALELLERGAELGSSDAAFSAGMRYLLQPPPPPEAEAAAGAANAGHDPSSPTTTMDMSLDPKAASLTPAQQSSPPALSLEETEAQARQEHEAKFGVPPNDALAAKWLTLAADGGNALAMMNLARMYLEGRASASDSSISTSPSSSSDATPPQARSTAATSSPRYQQLQHSSDLYARILAKAMGPEGQRAKALTEAMNAQARARANAEGVREDPLGGGTGGGGGVRGAANTNRLDDLGVRAEQGLSMVREEMEAFLAAADAAADADAAKEGA